MDTEVSEVVEVHAEFQCNWKDEFEPAGVEIWIVMTLVFILGLILG